MWLREPDNETMTWVYAYVWSGKSVLLDSIAKNLDVAHIPITVILCKWGDAEYPDAHSVNNLL